MPFKSRAQVSYMFAKHPKLAKEFAKKTPSIKALPEHVKPSGIKKLRMKKSLKG